MATIEELKKQAVEVDKMTERGEGLLLFGDMWSSIRNNKTTLQQELKIALEEIPETGFHSHIITRRCNFLKWRLHFLEEVEKAEAEPEVEPEA